MSSNRELASQISNYPVPGRIARPVSCAAFIDPFEYRGQAPWGVPSLALNPKYQITISLLTAVFLNLSYCLAGLLLDELIV
jgi:hypothetical protein